MHDFRQILTLVAGGSRGDIMYVSVINSDSWKYFTPLSFKTNMRIKCLMMEGDGIERIQELNQYSQWLLSLGEGTIPSPYQNLIEIQEKMVCKDLKEVEYRWYDNFVVNYAKSEYLFGGVIMSTANEIIQQNNFDMFQQVPGEITISESIGKCIEENHKAVYDSDFLNRMNASGMPLH